jgi:alpha-aminoadipic semialdehyde synthase
MISGLLSKSAKHSKQRILQTTSRNYATSIGIRREDKSRWERRSALTPETVKKLIQETGTQVYVQPSTKRIFTNESFEKVKKKKPNKILCFK